MSETDRAPQTGAQLIEQYETQFEMEASDRALLEKAAFTLDLLNNLDAEIQQRGPVDADGKISPAVQESRFQRAMLLKLLAELSRLSGNTGSNLGSRGTYGIKAVK